MTPDAWMQQPDRELRAAVFAYLNNEPMRPPQFLMIRQYLKRWLDEPQDNGREYLRREIETIIDRETLGTWLIHAQRFGIEPF